MAANGSKQKKIAPAPSSLHAGLWAVFMGMAGLLTTFLVVALAWSDESGVAALAAVASSIAAILSAYFSIQLSADRRRR
jgi:hypothetical protein